MYLIIIDIVLCQYLQHEFLTKHMLHITQKIHHTSRIIE
jgi:hypothetical protein